MAQVRRPRETDDQPFPRTSGVCWSPHGHLLRFHSLQNVSVPFPRRWSFTDYERVLKIHWEKEHRNLTVLDAKDDHSVQIVPSAAFRPVEDHWWTAAIRSYALEPGPA